jgi:streptogramin lyase
MMRKSVQCVAALLLVTLGSGLAWADFDLTFQGLVQTLNIGGSISFNVPAGIAVDPAGDVFVVDADNNRVVEVNAQGVASVVTITGLSPALSLPNQITIDGLGNLYVADSGNNRVVEITPAGVGSVISTGSVTLSQPIGVALDQSGDIFISDTLNNRIVTVAAGSSTGVVASILGGVTLSHPSAVVVDRMGNVLIADTGNDRIAEIDTSSNGTVLYTDSVSLSGPLSVALDVFGTVYIADTNNNRGLVIDNPVNGDLAPGDETYSINKTTVGFGHVQLGSATAVTLTLPFTTGETALGSVQVLTSGVASLDFTMGSDTTCNGTTGASTSCSVEVSFLPTAPGLRTGSVVLYDQATPPNAILTVPLPDAVAHLQALGPSHRPVTT